MDMPPKRLRLGEILINAGVLTEEQLSAGLARQQTTREPIGALLVTMGFVTEEQIKQALEVQFGLKSISLKGKVPQEIVRLVPESMIKQHKILPVGINQLTVAMVDPGNLLALDDLKLRFKGVTIQPAIISETEFKEIVKSLPRETTVAEVPAEEERPAEPNPAGDDQTASQLAMAMLSTALRKRATEIVLEPQEHETWVRMRVGGSLIREPSLPARLASGVISRFKVMAELALTAGNVPQTGTIKTRHEGRVVNIFLRTLPVRHGQLLTLRLFDHAALHGVSVESLVLHPGTVQALRKLLDSNSGLLLLNGPKHSGKATLLYALLREALERNKSLISFGQLPFDLEGVVQVPIEPHHEEETLAEIFEQAQDILAMPSLTEPNLARRLVQGALGGRFAVVGIPTAQRYLHQLLDLSELPIRAVANAVAGLVNSRVVRRLCDDCKVAYQPDEQTAAFFRPHNQTGRLHRAVGCEACHGTGYAGQIGIYGVTPFDAQVRYMAANNAPASQIEQYARQHGHMAMYDYAAWIAAQGFTTLEELGKTDLFDRVADATH